MGVPEFLHPLGRTPCSKCEVGMNSPYAILVAVGLILGLLLGLLGLYRVFMLSSKNRKEELQKTRDQEHAERVKRQKLDHQLNTGRMIHRYLSAMFQGYIIFEAIEDNGGEFSIHVRRPSTTMSGYVHILQLDFNFLEADRRLTGHVHYDAYGADCWFIADDDFIVRGQVTGLVERRINAEIEKIKGS